MASLPEYVAAAKPVPQANRVPWFSSTAPTYAGIMLWFVFWQDVPTGGGLPGGTLSQGLGMALLSLVVAALLCHFLYYLVPGLLGLKSGLPLYIVGTSTYGVTGGLLMPGFLMGVLQFGWLGVNAFFTSLLLVAPFFKNMEAATLSPPHMVVAAIYAIGAAFMGLKGIQYVARVASFLPAIPLVILLVLTFATIGGIGSFDAEATVKAAQSPAPAAAPADPTDTPADAPIVEEVTPDEELTEQAGPLAAKAPQPLSTWGVFAVILTYVIGFFATAGAAGCDFGMNNRDEKDVQLGGLVGIAGATIFAGGLALLIAAGAIGAGKAAAGVMNPTAMMGSIIGDNVAPVFWYLLAIAAFPPACFSAFIAANSFKTTLPHVNPFVSVGIGTAVSILLAVTGWAGDVVSVFVVIGASFGPVCGAMAADYLLAGRKWAGPRAGFNLAGWISWVVGFAVGGFNLVASWISGMEAYSNLIPIPPLSAFIVGFVLYYLLAQAGMQGQTLQMPADGEASA
jgi:cytosine permease